MARHWGRRFPPTFMEGGVLRLGFLLLIPFFLIRFGLLVLLDKDAVRRAAFFPPLVDSEKTAYVLYQLSNVAIILFPLFLSIPLRPAHLFATGIAVYLVGNLLLLVSIINFAHPSPSGINRKGLYRFSRNPMYVAYFVYFCGCAFLTQSLILLGILFVFQVSAHWIILSEERWCIQQFGDEFRQYMKETRRYL